MPVLRPLDPVVAELLRLVAELAALNLPACGGVTTRAKVVSPPSGTERDMTEQEFAELQTGETVIADGEQATVTLITEQGADVEFDSGDVLHFDYPKLARA